jgi:integrase/recombinase XerC
MEQVDRGVLPYSPRPKALPFSEMVNHYLNEGAGRLRPKSRERHEGCLRLHLVPYFKTQAIKAIGGKDVAAYIRFREKKRAAANTIYKELAALSAVFTFLVRDEMLAQNPVLAVQKPKLQVIRPNYTPTLEEVNRIFEHLHRWARRFFLALCTTGCRLGEIQKANIGDVNFDRGTLRVIRKGGKPQQIPLNPGALACIQDEVEFRTERFGIQPGADQPLFTNRYGRRYRKIRGSLKAACAKAKVPYITHHSLRHFFANALKDQKLDIGESSRFLGHANPTVTQNIYLHWRDEALHGRAQEVQVLRPSNRKVAKKCKILKMGLLPMGGVGLSL